MYADELLVLVVHVCVSRISKLIRVSKGCDAHQDDRACYL
jgi:hypothetical protein